AESSDFSSHLAQLLNLSAGQSALPCDIQTSHHNWNSGLKNNLSCLRIFINIKLCCCRTISTLNSSAHQDNLIDSLLYLRKESKKHSDICTRSCHNQRDLLLLLHNLPVKIENCMFLLKLTHCRRKTHTSQSVLP